MLGPLLKAKYANPNKTNAIGYDLCPHSLLAMVGDC